MPPIPGSPRSGDFFCRVAVTVHPSVDFYSITCMPNCDRGISRCNIMCLAIGRHAPNTLASAAICDTPRAVSFHGTSLQKKCAAIPDGMRRAYFLVDDAICDTHRQGSLLALRQ